MWRSSCSMVSGTSRDSSSVQSSAKRRSELAQPAELVALRERRNAEIGDAVREVLVRVGALAALKLRVQRQRNEPRLRRAAERADRSSRVGEEKPGPLLVVGEHL